MKKIIILYFIVALASCSKKTCTLYRYDLGEFYTCVKPGSDSFTFVLFKLPLSPFSDNHPEVIDSLNKLKALGYEVRYPGGLGFKNIDYNICQEYKLKNLSASCFCDK